MTLLELIRARRAEQLDAGEQAAGVHYTDEQRLRTLISLEGKLTKNKLYDQSYVGSLRRKRPLLLRTSAARNLCGAHCRTPHQFRPAQFPVLMCLS